MAKQLCRMKVKSGLSLVVCNKQLPVYYVGKIQITGRCDNYDSHMLPFTSGFCDSGWHEGDAPKDFQGGPAPSCKLWMICPCECHIKYDKMFLMSEMERQLVYNSKYVFHDTFSRPTPEERALAYARDHAPRGSEPVIVPSHAPDLVPATLVREFPPTQSGRAARGELEAWVRKSCDDWAVDKPPEFCTPLYISDDIAREQGINPPSTGAITAVLDRWSILGFARIDRKPIRFVEYTKEGISVGLETLKLRAKGRKPSPAQSISRRREN